MKRTSPAWRPMLGVLALGLLTLAPLAIGPLLPPSTGTLAFNGARSPPYFELHDVTLELFGPDGSSMRLSAGMLRMEGAATGSLVSTEKALTAWDASVRPRSSDQPEWLFERVQFRSTHGPFRWSGPAWVSLEDGVARSVRGGRGSFEVVEGTLRLHEQDRD